MHKQAQRIKAALASAKLRFVSNDLTARCEACFLPGEKHGKLVPLYAATNYGTLSCDRCKKTFR